MDVGGNIVFSGSGSGQFQNRHQDRRVSEVSCQLVVESIC